MSGIYPIGVLPVGVGDDFEFGTVSYSLVPSLYTDADTFYAATVGATYSLTPALYSDADTFYAATASSSLALTPSLYADADTFYTHTASASYSLLPLRYNDADIFYGHYVATPVEGLLPSLLVNVIAFYTPSVIRGHGYKANIPSDRPTYVSKDWEEVVRAAGPNQNDCAKYRFSNGREFR